VAINLAREFDEAINPGKRKPIFNAEERKLILDSVRYVDETLFYSSEDELTRLMREGQFDLRFLGEDYRGKPITAPDAIPEIVYIDRSHGYSTTSILNRILKSQNKDS
jgi:glycerol-3-phosphate cytidylyltransferase